MQINMVYYRRRMANEIHNKELFVPAVNDDLDQPVEQSQQPAGPWRPAWEKGGKKTAVCVGASTIGEALLYAHANFSSGRTRNPPSILPISHTSLAHVDCLADVDERLFDGQAAHHEDARRVSSWCGMHAANNLRPSVRTSRSNRPRPAPPLKHAEGIPRTHPSDTCVDRCPAIPVILQSGLAMHLRSLEASVKSAALLQHCARSWSSPSWRSWVRPRGHASSMARYRYLTTATLRLT